MLLNSSDKNQDVQHCSAADTEAQSNGQKKNLALIWCFKPIRFFSSIGGSDFINGRPNQIISLRHLGQIRRKTCKKSVVGSFKGPVTRAFNRGTGFGQVLIHRGVA